MTPEEILRIAEAAQGDPARLALAGIDLQFPDLLEAERDALRTALEAAAIPHWWDEKILPALLPEPLASQAPALAARLRQLRVVEPFPARGPGAANVHEATRLALRARMRQEDPAGFVHLSDKAAAYLAGEDTPHMRIETLFHRFTAEPKAAAEACLDLFDEWHFSGRFDALFALGVALEELFATGIPPGLARGVALNLLSAIGFHRQSLEKSLSQSREALVEFERLGDERRTSRAHSQIGDALRDLGDSRGALVEYQTSLAICKRLAVKEPDNFRYQRGLSVAHNKVGQILQAKNSPGEALAEYRAALSISSQLAKGRPDNRHLQRDFSVSLQMVGDVLRDLGELDEALAEYRASLAISENLASLDTENLEWQRDLAVSYNQIAIILRRRGDLPGALAARRKDYEISERLTARDPGNTQWQFDLIISCGNLARVLLEMPGGDRNEAALLIARGLELMDALAKMHSPTPAEQKERARLKYLQRKPPTSEPLEPRGGKRGL